MPEDNTATEMHEDEAAGGATPDDMEASTSVDPAANSEAAGDPMADEARPVENPSMISDPEGDAADRPTDRRAPRPAIGPRSSRSQR